MPTNGHCSQKSRIKQHMLAQKQIYIYIYIYCRMVQDLIVSFQKFQTHHNSSGHQTKLLGSFCPPMLKSQTSSYHRRSPHFRVPTVSVAKHGTETSFITQTIAAINMRRLFLAEANASNKGKVCHLRPKHH